MKPIAEMNILAIDDSQLIIQFLSAFLLSNGFRKISFASDAGNALLLVSEMKPRTYDLVILDRYLGDGSGIDVLKDIRKRDNGVPILMLTQEDESSKVMEALSEGVSDYLVKPFTEEALIAKVKRALAIP